MISEARLRAVAQGLRAGRHGDAPPPDPDGEVIDLRDPPPVAGVVAPVVAALLRGDTPVRVTFWDGSTLGPDDAVGVLHVRSPQALRRMLWAPGELGVARAYIAGDIDVEGDVYTLLRSLQRSAGVELKLARAAPAALVALRQLGGVGRPPAAPAIESRPRGRRHSPRRDATAITHHYDVGNDFYELVLGPAMTYSCARYPQPGSSLVDAQAAKHELVCRKLGLHEQPGARLLDVGCGWGSMALHAATYHGAQVVGVTISRAQAEYARARVVAAGLEDQVEIRLQDYRDVRGEPFDAISSIGMFEHVGAARVSHYFERLHALLRPHGRLLNHAISSRGGSRLPTRSFAYRYVFPDGELIDVGDVVLAMQRAGFEVRDVESLREHYALTLRQWVANLEHRWDDAVRLVGEPRARVWRLYMAGSALGFEDGGLGLHQVLGVVPTREGTSGMPLTRSDWD